MPVMTKTPLGDDIVILSRAEYDALTFGRHDEDAADAARANNILADIERGTEILLTSEQASQLLEAKTPLAFWRKHRGVTQETLSKAIGGYGGYLCASTPVIELIRNRARSFVYSTASVLEWQ